MGKYEKTTILLVNNLDAKAISPERNFYVITVSKLFLDGICATVVNKITAKVSTIEFQSSKAD